MIVKWSFALHREDNPARNQYRWPPKKARRMLEKLIIGWFTTFVATHLAKLYGTVRFYNPDFSTLTDNPYFSRLKRSTSDPCFTYNAKTTCSLDPKCACLYKQFTYNSRKIGEMQTTRAGEE